MSEYLVDIKNERLSFFTPAGEVKALNDVSLYLKEGEVLGIVGESGSGKSVTSYSIMGLTADPGRIVGGTIEFNGHHIEQLSEKELRKIRGKEVSITEYTMSEIVASRRGNIPLSCCVLSASMSRKNVCISTRMSFPAACGSA